MIYIGTVWVLRAADQGQGEQERWRRAVHRRTAENAGMFMDVVTQAVRTHPDDQIVFGPIALSSDQIKWPAGEKR